MGAPPDWPGGASAPSRRGGPATGRLLARPWPVVPRAAGRL